MDYQIDPNESVSAAIVRAASAIRGVDPCSLRPLGEVLDPDALDGLFETRYDGTPRRGGRVSFVFDGCRITVDNGEYLTLKLLEDTARSERERAYGDGGVKRREQ